MIAWVQAGKPQNIVGQLSSLIETYGNVRIIDLIGEMKQWTL